MQDGNQTSSDPAGDYCERGQRLADMLAAHVAEQHGLVATFSSGSVQRGPSEGLPEFIIVVARQVGYPPSQPPQS